MEYFRPSECVKINTVNYYVEKSLNEDDLAQTDIINLMKDKKNLYLNLHKNEQIMVTTETLN